MNTVWKMLFQCYYANLEKVQVKDETGVIKKERQMAPEDVSLK